MALGASYILDMCRCMALVDWKRVPSMMAGHFARCEKAKWVSADTAGAEISFPCFITTQMYFRIRDRVNSMERKETKSDLVDEDRFDNGLLSQDVSLRL